MKIVIHSLAAAIMLLGAGASQAAPGDWTLKVGAHTVNPQSDNGTLAGGTLEADIDSDSRPTVTAEYALNERWGIELLAALPFEHDVYLDGARAGSVKHLPPTLSLQYHFNPEGSVSPFLGAGLNYTRFFSEDSTGPLAGADLDLDASFGLALHAGLDFRLNEHWLLMVDTRWMQISSDVKVDGTDVGEVDIDPFVYGVGVGYRF